MAKAILDGKIIAESDSVVHVESNAYFPPESVKMELFSKSPTPYTCPWKGKCQYYNVTLDGKEYSDVAWAYPDPKPEAKNITGYVAFWKDVKVEE